MSKPFNLEAALAGEPVETRDGKKVTELYYLKTHTGPSPVIAVVEGALYCYYTDGKWWASSVSGRDLVMTSTKHQVWHGVFKQGDSIGVTGAYRDKTTVDEVLNKAHAEVIQIYCTEWEE